MGLLGVLQERRIFFISHARSLVQVRKDNAGVDGVDADAEGASSRAAQRVKLVHRRLGNAVGQDAGKARVPVTLETLTTAPFVPLNGGCTIA